MDEESVPFIETSLPRHKRQQAGILPPHWLPWLLVLLLSAYILIISAFGHIRRPSDAHFWHPTDFAPARSAIQSTATQFTSSLDFLDPKRIFRVFDPATPAYIGNASAEINQNWDDLILPADIYITDEEASTLPPNTRMYRSPETGAYKIELEVFHSLHCLNMIRMRVYSDQYPEMLTDNAKVHVDHCIESLRELIMCEGNMTPIPIEWSEKGERINPNYAQKHSCRNFEALKQWTNRRAETLP